MKLLAALAATLVTTFIALVVAINHRETLPGLLCPQEFGVENLACHFAGFGITLALVPISGVVVGIATWMMLLSREKRAGREPDA
jgi:hypothetical protein